MTGLTSIVRGPSVSPALLELEHSPLNSLPRNRVPSIHRLSSNRAHSLSTPTDTSIFQVIVSASAYPVAFPRAFASQTILLPDGLRLTPAPLVRRATVRYLVPDLRLSWHLGTHCSPGYFQDAAWIKNEVVQPFTVPILDQADNPRRLVAPDDDSDVSLIAYPYATLLDGIPRWVRSYRLSFPLQGLRISRYPGESASPLHLGDRNFTCTRNQVIKDLIGLSPSSLTSQSFRGNDSQSLVAQRHQRINLRRTPRRKIAS
jgi:hypothetical protein